MKKLFALTLAHLTVDFACFTALFGSVSPAVEDKTALAALFLTYNLIAFGLQCPLGAFLDAKKFPRAGFAALGAGVTALGLAVSYLGSAVSAGALLPVLGMVAAALGNAAFHVGAGSFVLTACGGKMAPSGLFNSAGALGVGLGTVLGTGRPALAFPLALAAALLAFAALMTPSIRGGADKPCCRELSALVRPLPPERAAAILCLAVAFHAFASAAAPDVPGLTGALALACPVMIFLGKLSGGAIADRIGAKPALLLSLPLSAALFALCGVWPALSLPAVLLMNVSVPIVQCVLAGALPESPGFAFGLSKLALVTGTAFAYFVPVSAPMRPYHAAALTALSLLAAAAVSAKPANLQKEENNHDQPIAP